MRRQVKGLNNTVYTLKKQYRRGRRIACHGLLGGAHAAVAGAVCGGGVKRVGRLSDEEEHFVFGLLAQGAENGC